MNRAPSPPRYRQARAPLRADFPGETVLMSFDTGRYYGLEGTALSVWQLLETPRTLEDLVAALAESHDVPVERCRQDVAPFLEALTREGLVEAMD